MASAQSKIEVQPELWANAGNTGNAETIVALYANDAVFWGTSLKTVTKGRNGIKAYFEAAFSRFPGLHSTIEDVVVQNFGDIATSTGIAKFSNIVDGKAQWTAFARFTFTYAKRNGDWKIVNHHSSIMPN